MLLRYILATHEHIDRNKLRRVVVETIDAEAGENVVTVYEQLIEEGRRSGLRQGRAEGRAELLLEQLAAKFGAVPADMRDRIRQASADDLAAWGTRVLTATTLEEALASPRAPQRSRRAPRSRR